jgi:hypothetical protein
MADKFYELDRDLSRFGDCDEEIRDDGYLENEFKNWGCLDGAFYEAIPITTTGMEGVIIRDEKRNPIAAQMPADITFVGLKEWLPPTDFPYMEIPIAFWPIMSRRMLVPSNLDTEINQQLKQINKQIENPKKKKN